MQSTTRQAALRIQEAFVALPDDVLLTKIAQWAEVQDPDGEGWDAIPEYMIMLGYTVQSRATDTIYASLDDLFAAEDDADDWTTIPPSPATIRQVVSGLSAGDVYHGLVVDTLGEILPFTTLTRAWGDAPGSWDDRSGGYAFMQYRAIYLRTLAGQPHPRKPQEGRLISQQDFEALRGFLASEDGSDLPFDDDLGDSGDAWEASPIAPLAPTVCMCGGTFALTERWLVAAGADVPLNLATLREVGLPCDCLVVQANATWPGPELRPPEPEWNPFDRPKKKKKKGKQKVTKRR